MLTPSVTDHVNCASLLLCCRARARPGQRRTETRCGMPGARGANVHVPVEEEPRTPFVDASAPSKPVAYKPVTCMQECSV